jgi:hypothetical protein
MSKLDEIRQQIEQETMARWYADGAEVSLRRLWDRLAVAEASVAVLRAALEQIDREPVGACADDLGDIEPCESCGEMRTIAANALAGLKEPS